MAATGENELLELLTRYNEDLWPLHVVVYAAVVVAVALVFAQQREIADRVIAGLLACLWVWLGLVFHGVYATDVDAVLGTAYAVLFIVQGSLFWRDGVVGRKLSFRPRAGCAGVVGWSATAYAIVVYPILGLVLGHGWPESPLLGMAPCPTTIATLGLLLLAAPPVPRRLLVVPFLWAVLAPPAAMARGVYEDAGLLIAGVVTVGLVLIRDRHQQAEGHPRVGTPSVETAQLTREESRVRQGRLL